VFPVVASATQVFKKMVRISVFIDGANFCYGVKSIKPRYTDFHFDFKKYINHITKEGKLVDVYYFTATLKQTLNPEIYAKHQKMLARLKKADYKVILSKRKIRRDIDGSIRHQIKEDDIRLALQMQKDAYNNKFDIAYLLSGDGDFVPLPEFLKEKGKKVCVYYFPKLVSDSLLRACDYNCMAITKKILNKFFLRESKEKKKLNFQKHNL